MGSTWITWRIYPTGVYSRCICCKESSSAVEHQGVDWGSEVHGCNPQIFCAGIHICHMHHCSLHTPWCPLKPDWLHVNERLALIQACHQVLGSKFLLPLLGMQRFEAQLLTAWRRVLSSIIGCMSPAAWYLLWAGSEEGKLWKALTYWTA